MENQQSGHHRKHTKRLSILVVVLWALLAAAALERQNISDWWRLTTYDPPANVAALARDDTMTSYARKLFYLNRPSIDGKTAFAPECPSGTEQTVVLGCYKGDENGIFLLSVTDKRLNGIVQVTAAHEMLHAAYDRLSAHDKAQVDSWLNDYYRHGLKDKAIKAQIAAYQQSEPHDVTNEMHSVFGTEVADLPAPLEQYYRRYFDNRSAVVSDYHRYQAAFTDLQKAVKHDDAQLSSWKQQIDRLEADLLSKQQSLSAQQAALNQEGAAGKVQAYNNGVASYNADVDAYNSEIGRLKRLISSYNTLVAKRNALALENQQLVQEITAKVPSTR